jgi:Thioesterase-like superfamily
MSADEAEMALFGRGGRQFSPTPLTTGPWRSDAMHGGAASALIGAVITDTVDAGENVARIQIDLERPVPIEPLTVEVSRRAQSRRISYLAIEIHAASGRVVNAKVLLLRGQPVPTAAREDIAPIGPDRLAPMTWAEAGHVEGPVFHIDAVDHRIVEGGYRTPGPAVAWLRLRGPVVAGESPSGLAQLLAVADFGSALSQAMAPGSGLGLINVDVNVTLIRAPVGPWFYLEANGNLSDDGIGAAVTRLRDRHGPLGAITQSQIAHALRQR